MRSTIRAGVEHVCGFQHNSMGGKLIRTIGLARAKTKIALMNLTFYEDAFVKPLSGRCRFI